MVKLPQKTSYRSRKYDKITNEERAIVIQMKENGATCRQISEVLHKNIKTIQSIKSVEKKSEYGILKKALVQYGYETIMANEELDKSNIKKLGKFTKKLIKAQLVESTSKFWNLIPEQKKLSNKRRIIQQIVQIVLEKVQNTNPSTDSTQTITNQNIITKEEAEDPKPAVQVIAPQQQVMQSVFAYLLLTSLMGQANQVTNVQQFN